MGYMHIDNLYKNKDIFLFKECYATEKIHGTSAHVKWKNGKLSFFSGGSSYEDFLALFDKEFIEKKFQELGYDEVVIFGEAYGGKVQKMSDTYGKELKFVVFEVKIGNRWLEVPKMDKFIRDTFGFDVVDWVKIPTTIEAIDAERDKPSVQAIKNGCGNNKPREGIVLRPPIEVTLNNGARIIAKYKSEEFAERHNQPRVKTTDKEKLKVLKIAEEIANEWVTEMRLTHVLDKFPQPYDITQMGDVIRAMIEDIEREADGEIVKSKATRKAISSHAAKMFKARINAHLHKS